MKLLNVKEVTEKLSCSRSHLYELLKNDAFLPGCGAGKRRRWREDEVDAFIILFSDDGSHERNTDTQLKKLGVGEAQIAAIRKMVENSRKMNTKCSAQSAQLQTLGA